jgi:hypothetical protein
MTAPFPASMMVAALVFVDVTAGINRAVAERPGRR